MMSAGDSVKITVFDRGAHGSMPQLSVDPVVLAASIVLRLQTIVSRETEPGEFAVVTVGASNAGSKSNIIPDRAELLLNVRTYDTAVRGRVIASIERIVRGECEAAGAPKEPTFEYFDQFPLTDNSEAVNGTVTEALTEYFGAEAVLEATPATASEDFSELPNAFGIPYAYWFVGSFDAEQSPCGLGSVARRLQGHSSSVRTTCAGDPTTTPRAGTSLVTTEAAATTASSPMVMPGRTVTFDPIQTLPPMTIGAGCMSARRSGSIP